MVELSSLTKTRGYNQLMEHPSIIRILDENLNRLAEGLRVLEDIARMILNDTPLTQQLKSLRHNLIRADFPINLQLIQSRDSVSDIGSTMDVKGEKKSKDLPEIAVANSRRVQESLRVLEEMAKVAETNLKLDSEVFRKARFEIYTLEQKLISRLLRRDKSSKISGLYVIIDTQTLRGKNHLEATRQVIQAGVKIIQLRDKTMPKKLLIPIAREIQELCHRNDALFIMNDYLDVALAIEADGLHIGQEDLSVEQARKFLPLDKILGVSVTSVELTRKAEAAGADYIAVGAMYPTSSKDDIKVVGLERLRRIKKIARTPVVAIGGIHKDNAREVLKAGADSICVISAVLNSLDVIRAARDLIEIIEAENEKTN
jgi:thiamine-phosphate pyrophosphorylase